MGTLESLEFGLHGLCGWSKRFCPVVPVAANTDGGNFDEFVEKWIVLIGFENFEEVISPIFGDIVTVSEFDAVFVLIGNVLIICDFEQIAGAIVSLK